jgi:hypothetical protein
MPNLRQKDRENMTNMPRWIVVVVALAAVACCPAPIAQLSGRWVYASPGGIGKAGKPSYGAPLTIGNAAGVLAAVATTTCVPRAAIDQQFGKTCERHETEGGAQPSFEPPAMTDEVPIGITPTPGEAIWYCDKHTVVRVVLQRCGTGDTFGVSQIVVAPNESKP